jgi:ribosomal protein RSM22 (predicted rRNA methylase)
MMSAYTVAMRPLNPTSVSLPLLETIEQIAVKEGIGGGRVSQGVAELSRLFTKERSALRRSYLDDPTLAAAYLQYFLPVNLAKIQVLLNELPYHEAKETFSVLDLGSGPGTGALAVLDWWHRRKSFTGGSLSAIAVDSVPAALRQAEQLWNRYCEQARVAGASLVTHKIDLEQGLRIAQDWKKISFDLIILANCLNEIYADEKNHIAARSALVEELLSLLAPHGTVMILEPALRETSRSLHQVRDQLLKNNRCTVYSPCLHERDCPALAHPHDWCHEERPWIPPRSIREIDKQVGFIKDTLKFSYLLLRKDGKTIVDRRPDVYRVVSELRVMKGEKRAWLCNELGRQEVGRQDRLASPTNAGFDQWHRGAIVQIERIVRKERDGKVSDLGRIGEDGAVEVLRSV